MFYKFLFLKVYSSLKYYFNYLFCYFIVLKILFKDKHNFFMFHKFLAILII